MGVGTGLGDTKNVACNGIQSAELPARNRRCTDGTIPGYDINKIILVEHRLLRNLVEVVETFQNTY